MLTIANMLILAVAIIAGVALVMVFVRASGISVPAWVGQVLGIVLVAAVVILAIRFVMSL